jgi:ferric-dicitrate binding protein FerR (iron transport regulator)
VGGPAGSRPAGEEEAALDAWLALDPRHRGALLRAQAGMAMLDRCRALHDDDAPEQAPQDEAPMTMPAGAPPGAKPWRWPAWAWQAG